MSKNIPPQATALLEIDLSAIKHNYRQILSILKPGAEIATVLKANAYGLGFIEVAQALSQEGCRNFFVSNSIEAVNAREHIKDGHIYTLNGLLEGTEDLFIEHNLTPSLIEKEQVLRWVAHAKKLGRKLPAIIHIDTGICREGLEFSTFHEFVDKGIFDALDIQYLMSHLACANQPENPMNGEQLQKFKDALALMPGTKGCFANSGGISFGHDYHFDMVRPGLSLYGYYPTIPNLKPAVKVSGRILSFRDVEKGAKVGYDSSYVCAKKTRLALLGLGYGDDIIRALSNISQFTLKGNLVPVVGNISMDLITIDVTDVPDNMMRVGGWVEIFHSTQSLLELAKVANTNPRELLVRLGRRYHRIYR